MATAIDGADVPVNNLQDHFAHSSGIRLRLFLGCGEIYSSSSSEDDRQGQGSLSAQTAKAVQSASRGDAYIISISSNGY